MEEYTEDWRLRVEVPHPPGILHRYQNKRVTKFDCWKLLKTKREPSVGLSHEGGTERSGTNGIGGASSHKWSDNGSKMLTYKKGLHLPVYL